jgi:SAM-dependent methyltransferase
MEDWKNILGGVPRGKVLDVATGTGGFIHFLLEALKEYDEIVGIDTSERSATVFAEVFKDKPNVRFEKMDAAQIDFPDAAFDMVCMANSLHHMADLGRVLAEMRRVLKPGGHFIIAEMYRDGQTETQLTHVYLHHWWAAVDTSQGITHGETYTRQQIVDLVDGLGLQGVTYHDLCDLSGDPQQPDAIKELNNVIDRYIERFRGASNAAELNKRGEELRQRLQEIGFHSATTLLAIGKSPAS